MKTMSVAIGFVSLGLAINLATNDADGSWFSGVLLGFGIALMWRSSSQVSEGR